MRTLETNQEVSDGSLLVSVCMTAYNSAAWLSRAIDSVLQQQKIFPIEIVIGDDCSTDGSAEVLHYYQKEHAATIRVLNRPKKLGMQRNFYDTFEHCRGKYIAWLDADDYWTDPHKLNLQVAVLEADSSVSVCGHFVRHVSPTGEVIAGRRPLISPGRYGIGDIVAENFVPSPSILFRNGVHRFLPEAFFGLTGLVDWPILLQSALEGDIVLLDRVMADYVFTPGSAYQSKGPLHQDAIDLEFYEALGPTLPKRLQRSILAARGKRYEAMSYHLLKQGNLSEARKAAHRAVCLPRFMDNIVSKVKALAAAEIFARF